MKLKLIQELPSPGSKAMPRSRLVDARTGEMVEDVGGVVLEFSGFGQTTTVRLLNIEVQTVIQGDSKP